ncbi:MAG: phospho-N-acetylmuramoyl-pentapeptide-transferase [Clostridia bacterium]|nr:phospho-N-acetylmuramoyl-pentapeptide-transferase [Clostridia bacterium]
MNIQIKALLASFIGTLILGFIAIPILKKLKVGQVVRDDGPQSHLKKSGTPTMGGIIMLLVIIAVSAVVATKYPAILPVALLTLGYGFVGFVDDFIKLVLKNPTGLKPSYKMFGLIIISVSFIVYLISTGFTTETYLPIFKTYIPLPVWAYIPCAVFIMLACTNSLNLTDGLDGLAAGVNAIIMIFFTFIALTFGSKEMSIFSAIVTGTSIGFLIFNLHPAKVFMGDTGSLALGGAFCGVALLLKIPLILIVVAGVCVLETISVILQVSYFKATKGKRLFKMAPIHHHLELSGWKETSIVTTFWITTIILCVLGAYML